MSKLYAKMFSVLCRERTKKKLLICRIFFVSQVVEIEVIKRISKIFNDFALGSIRIDYL